MYMNTNACFRLIYEPPEGSSDVSHIPLAKHDQKKLSNRLRKAAKNNINNIVRICFLCFKTCTVPTKGRLDHSIHGQ